MAAIPAVYRGAHRDRNAADPGAAAQLRYLGGGQNGGVGGGSREINSKLRALVVLNAADARGHDNEDAIAALKEVQSLEVLDVVIGRRKAFPNAAAAGRAVTEYTPKDSKAVDELCSLLNAVYISERHRSDIQ